MAIIDKNINLPLYSLEEVDAKRCIDILIGRFVELSHTMQLKYSKDRLNSLFLNWTSFDKPSFDEYVIRLIEDESIDYLDVLNVFIDGENDGANVEKFVLFFKAALPRLNQRISEDKRAEANTRARQLYCSHSGEALQNH